MDGTGIEVDPDADRPAGGDRPIGIDGSALPWIVTTTLLLLGLAWMGGAWTLGVGEPSSPGPGGWPLVAGCAVSGLAALMLARKIRSRRRLDPLLPAPSPAGSAATATDAIGLRAVEAGLSSAIPDAPLTRRVAAACASLVLFAVAFPALGFPAATVLLLLFWFRGLGRESWPLSVGLAVAATIVLYAVFALALGVIFPDPALIAWGVAVHPAGT